MNLIGLIVTLILIGLALWGVQAIPMDGTIRRIITVIVIIAAVLYVLQAFGLLSGVPMHLTGRGRG